MPAILGYAICALLLGSVGYFAAESITSYYREKRRREIIDRLTKQTWTHASGPAEWR